MRNNKYKCVNCIEAKSLGRVDLMFKEEELKKISETRLKYGKK